MYFLRISPWLLTPRILYLLTILVLIFSCNSPNDILEPEIVGSPLEINLKAGGLIQSTLEEVLQNPSMLPDSIKLKNASLLQEMYSKNDYSLVWSAEGVFKSRIDSLIVLIDSSQRLSKNKSLVF